MTAHVAHDHDQAAGRHSSKGPGASSRREILKSGAMLSATGIFAYGFQFITGMVNPRLLGPHYYGGWQLVGLITGYAAYSHLGIAQALRRELPMLMARDEEKRVAFVRDVGYSSSLILSLVVVAVLIGLYSAGYTFRGVLDLSILILICSTILVSRYGAAYSNVLTGYGRFKSLALFDVLAPGLFLVFSIPLAWAWKLEGMILATLLSQGIAFWVIRKHAAIRVGWQFDWHEIRRLLKIGTPILMLVFFQKIFNSLEMTLIAVFLPLQALGIYGFTVGIVAMADLVPSSFNKLILREMAASYGRSSAGDYTCFRSYLGVPNASYVWMSTIMGIGAFFGFKALVLTFYQEFAASTELIFWLVAAYIFYNFRPFPSLFFTIADRYIPYWTVLLGSLVINLTGDLLLLKNGFGLLGVAQMSAISTMIFGTAAMLVCYRYVWNSITRGLKSALTYNAAVVVSLAGVYLLDSLRFGTDAVLPFYISVWFEAFARIGFSLIWTTIVFCTAFRHLNLWHEVKITVSAAWRKALAFGGKILVPR